MPTSPALLEWKAAVGELAPFASAFLVGGYVEYAARDVPGSLELASVCSQIYPVILLALAFEARALRATSWRRPVPRSVRVAGKSDALLWRSLTLAHALTAVFIAAILVIAEAVTLLLVAEGDKTLVDPGLLVGTATVGMTAVGAFALIPRPGDG
jgi:hypothetical protein